MIKIEQVNGLKKKNRTSSRISVPYQDKKKQHEILSVLIIKFVFTKNNRIFNFFKKIQMHIYRNNNNNSQAENLNKKKRGTNQPTNGQSFAYAEKER